LDRSSGSGAGYAPFINIDLDVILNAARIPNASGVLVLGRCRLSGTGSVADVLCPKNPIFAALSPVKHTVG
jgi:hypothetical protein